VACVVWCAGKVQHKANTVMGHKSPSEKRDRCGHLPALIKISVWSARVAGADWA
jgi:hypothetical protein